MAKKKSPPITDPNDPNYIPSDEDLFNFGRRMLGRMGKYYDAHPDEMPPAAVVAQFLNFGKALGVTEKLADEARREEAQAVSGTFRSRITDEELSNRTVHTVITSVEDLCRHFQIDSQDYVSVAWMARERARSADAEEQVTLLKIAEDAESKAAGE